MRSDRFGLWRLKLLKTFSQGPDEWAGKWFVQRIGIIAVFGMLVFVFAALAFSFSLASHAKNNTSKIEHQGRIFCRFYHQDRVQIRERGIVEKRFIEIAEQIVKQVPPNAPPEAKAEGVHISKQFHDLQARIYIYPIPPCPLGQ